MLSVLCFLIVNLTLTVMLSNFKKKGLNIDLMFMICLTFTFLGNAFIGISINTVIAFINLCIGSMLIKIR